MYMGDRWAFPRQYSAATYVWQPISFWGTEIAIPEFYEAWQVNTSTGVASEAKIEGEVIENSNVEKINYFGEWNHRSDSDAFPPASRSDSKDAGFTVAFEGKQIVLYGVARTDGGCAQVELENSDGETILSSVIDMYSKSPATGPGFMSPVLEKDNYVMKVSVMGDHGNWYDKSGNKFGSTGDFVSLEKIIISK